MEVPRIALVQVIAVQVIGDEITQVVVGGTAALTPPTEEVVWVVPVWGTNEIWVVPRRNTRGPGAPPRAGC